jgi:hypothetical protein
MRPSSFSRSARPSPNPSSHRPTGSTPDRPHEPSERRCAGLSLPPHRHPTSSVSRVVTHLARCTPPTALVRLPSTPQERSRRQAVAARATASASAAVTAPRRARTRAMRMHCGPPRRPGQAATSWHPAATAGRQPTPRPGTVVLGQNPGPLPDFVFLFFSI